MSLYSQSTHPPIVVNGSRNMPDSTGTINPQALNSNSTTGVPMPPSDDQRGTKRSRSPDDYTDYLLANDNDEAKRRKRGRQSKTPRLSQDFGHGDQVPSLASHSSSEALSTTQGRQQASTAPPVTTPTQSSPGSKTLKSTIKALPTVRDHTSDQLGPGNDEYIPREYDSEGEHKVNDMGYLQGGRVYKIKTFTLPGRGEKLFMLATECARTLQYRDSYLLFNKNRSLYKIIASPKEKEELVSHEVLPYSYRSRQIALVTARSMFRQFGSRVVKDGRRVRDDYWEAKARKQGFTEDDPAGEKRPGAARAREVAAQEALNSRQLQAYGNVVYANGPSYGPMQPPPIPPGIAATIGQYPILEAYDARYKDVIRPRQDLAGPPYSDLTRSSSDAEMASQSAHAADFSRTVNAQNRYRNQIVSDYWHRPHPPAVTTPQQATAELAATQNLSSPQYDEGDRDASTTTVQPLQAPMNPPSFPHPHNPTPSPTRTSSMTYPREFNPGHANLPRTSSSLSISQSASQQPPIGYNSFSPVHTQQSAQPAWGQPPPQPQQSPAMTNRMFNPQQSSPHLQPGSIASPMPVNPHTLSQSPHPQPQQQQPQHPMQPPPMFPPGAAGMMPTQQQLYGPGAGLRAMNTAGFPAMGMPQQGMYGIAGQAQFMQPPGQPGQQFMSNQWQNFQ